mmetsp:Transcript_27667/g.70104  ORF Transcript_27667/g.70104 Transcript_27667/m.70104 type:complete len:270 (+) Transcript_27667:844-1653(+)
MPTSASSRSVVPRAATAGRSLAGEASRRARHAVMGASGARSSGRATAESSASTASSRSLSALMSIASSSVHGAAEGERVPEPTTRPLSSRWTVSVAPSLAASRKWRGWSYDTVPMASRTSSPLTVPLGQPTETARELVGSGEGGASAGEASRPRERMRCTPACTPPLSRRAMPLAMPPRRDEVGPASALAGRTTRVARLATTPSKTAHARALARRLTMKGPTAPGSGMCRKVSDMLRSSSESSWLPRPMAVTLTSAAGPPRASTSAFCC